MILFLAGTSDARELAIEIQRVGFQVLATVVTESADKKFARCEDSNSNWTINCNRYGIFNHRKRISCGS